MKNITKNLIFFSFMVLAFASFDALKAEAQFTTTCNNAGCSYDNFYSSYNTDFTGSTYNYTNPPNNNPTPAPTPTPTPTPTPSPTLALRAVTYLATPVSENSVKLNGVVLDTPNSSVTVWFEYGTTVSVSSVSESQTFSSTNSKPFSRTLNNLAPNTIYYFRAVAQNNYGVSRGDIVIFKTAGQVVVPTPIPTPTPMPTPTPAPVITTVTVPIIKTQIISASNDVSLKIETRFENVSAGDEINYEVTYKNIDSISLHDLILNVSFAKDTAFVKSSAGDYSEPDHALTLKIKELKGNEEGHVSIIVTAPKNAKIGDVLVAKATMVYPDPISKIKENVVAYALNNIVEKQNTQLAAASIFGNGGFLPNTLIGWLLLIVAILALIYFGRKFYASMNPPIVIVPPKKKEEEHEEEFKPPMPDQPINRIQ